MTEAQTFLKQRRIRSPFPLLLLWMRATSFWVCGSIYINYTLLYQAIMHEFFALLQKCSRWVLTSSEARSRQAVQPEWTRIQWNPEPNRDVMCLLEAVLERNTCLHVTTCSIIIVLPWLFVFMIMGSQNHYWHWNANNCPALDWKLVKFLLRVTAIHLLSHHCISIVGKVTSPAHINSTAQSFWFQMTDIRHLQ